MIRVLKIDISLLAFRTCRRGEETSASSVALQQYPEATDMRLLLGVLTLQVACASGEETIRGSLKLPNEYSSHSKECLDIIMNRQDERTSETYKVESIVEFTM
jgi:hypothetical protein